MTTRSKPFTQAIALTLLLASAGAGFGQVDVSLQLSEAKVYYDTGMQRIDFGWEAKRQNAIDEYSAALGALQRQFDTNDESPLADIVRVERLRVLQDLDLTEKDLRQVPSGLRAAQEQALTGLNRMRDQELQERFDFQWSVVRKLMRLRARVLRDGDPREAALVLRAIRHYESLIGPVPQTPSVPPPMLSQT